MSDTASQVLTTAEVAAEVGTDPKNLRKFFRSSAAAELITPVGQGKRYAITIDDVPALKAAFSAWAGGKRKADDEDGEPAADKAPAKAAPKPRKSRAKAAPAVEVIDDEENLDDDEPSADALAELDDEDLGDVIDDEPEY